MSLSFTIGGVYGVSLLGRINDQSEIRNVFHYQKVDGGTITQTEGLDDLEDILTALIALLTAIQTTLIVFRGFDVYALEGDPQTASRTFAAPIAGTATGDPLPFGVSMLTYFNTGVPGRQLRKYWAGLTEASNSPTGGFAGASITTPGTNVLNFLMTDQVEANGTWRYGHYRTGVPGSFVFPVDGTLQYIPSYQRRRRLGSGV